MIDYDVMVFVRYSCGLWYRLIFNDSELLWYNDSSALAILSKKTYLEIRESVIKQKGRHPVTEINLIKPKKAAHY